MTDSPTTRPRVALFVTCMVDTLYPEVGTAAADLLERHGVDIVFPDKQTCCGQPAYNAGYRSDARAVARHFVDVFWPLVDEGSIDAIVAPSGSCVAMVKLQYPILFEATDEEYHWRATQLGEVTYELTQYLVDFLGVLDTGADFGGKIAYHPCCHLLRELRIDAQPRRLLAALRDAEIVEFRGADECCGFGGLFALKNAEISTAMGRRKAHNLKESDAEVVAMNDVSCMTHLNGILEREGLSCRAVHIAELLNRRSESDGG
ncbi:MAG: (Fe-S)-binding protein [Gemmatimonadetes bacterium]|nr:(Fe-S)-binding protein [Gemmatimonadota bacterium]NIO31387.1 (Fe-S)-binding protein [Gemmatimonadota bacterium]